MSACCLQGRILAFMEFLFWRGLSLTVSSVAWLVWLFYSFLSPCCGNSPGLCCFQDFTRQESAVAGALIVIASQALSFLVV
jgi:hypothetical protein